MPHFKSIALYKSREATPYTPVRAETKGTFKNIGIYNMRYVALIEIQKTNCSLIIALRLKYA
jgi:CMP-2-keto-3-deoxyoctulosonic acid synthetase